MPEYEISHILVFDWAIVTYFFLGGLGAGAFIFSVAAKQWLKDYEPLAKIASYVALVSVALVHCCRSSVHEFGNLSSSARYADLACALYLTTLSYNILIRHSNACSAFAF